jgi:hypothetical protein
MKSILKYVILTAFLATSCQKLLFNQDESTREISLNDFHAANISGIYNFILVQDSTNRLSITGKNDISSISAIIKDDTLIIDDHKKRSFDPDKNSLTLHFSNLEQIVFTGPVNVTNRDTIRADNFMFEATGEIAEVRLVIKCNQFVALNNSNTIGYLHFIGKAESCWIWNRYGSCMYADSLLCKSAVVYNESVGDVNVNASGYIEAFIRSSGNIGYHGDPVIKISENRGCGRMIHLN